MRLYLVQHGEAAAKEVDPDRPLTERGAGDVQRLAVFLGQNDVEAARVVHSGKTRARQTAEALTAPVEPRVTAEAIEGLEPLDSADRMAMRIVEWTRDTILVGHQPFLGRLAARLLCGREEGFSIGFTPGAALCLEQEDDGTWTLLWMLRPDLLS